MNYSEILNKLIEILLPFTVLLLTYIIRRASVYIKSKITNENLKFEIDRFNDFVETVVKEQQVIADDCKKMSEDGKLSKISRNRLKKTSEENIKSLIGDKKLKKLEKALRLSDGTIDRYISSKIETYIHDLKTGRV